MSRLDEAVETVRGRLPGHFASADKGNKEQLEFAFNAVRASLQADLDELKRLSGIAIPATVFGLLLIGLAVVLVMTQVVTMAAVTGVVGVASEIYPLLLFRRIDALRKSIAGHLGFFRSSYGLLLIMDEADRAPAQWYEVVAQISKSLVGGSAA